MFFHDQGLQYKAEPTGSDPVDAEQRQEVVGGQFGEISVMMQYLLQGGNVRMPGKYNDLVMDVATEAAGGGTSGRGPAPGCRPAPVGAPG